MHTDETSRRNLGISTYVGIFMDNLGTFLGAFSTKIAVFISFQDELHGIIAIEYANRKN